MSGEGRGPDRPGAAAGGCEGALAAVPGRGPSPGTLREQQEQERGESTPFCTRGSCSSIPSYATDLHDHSLGVGVMLIYK